VIAFEAPAWLWLALPGLLGWWLFARVQRRALAWLQAHVAKRFRPRLSVYSRGSLMLHMGLLLVMGLALIAAAAGPFASGETETVSATGRLLLLVDASASMYAEDVAWPAEQGLAESSDGSVRRIDVARSISGGLMRRLEGYRFALGSFSGTGAVHLPMTADLGLVEDALRTLEVHGYYRNTGSSFATALDLVPHFVDRRGYRLQVVLLSDGEQPIEEDYGESLDALAALGVPVHAVAIGSLEGQSRRILDFRDVVEKVEEPRVLVSFHTRRVDEHLKRISRKTKGSFQLAEPGVIDRLSREILAVGSDPEPFEHDAARSDLSGRYLMLFLVGFLLDALWLGRRPRFGADRFDLSRLGDSEGAGHAQGKSPPSAWVGVRRRMGGPVAMVALATALSTACVLPLGQGRGGTPHARAHRENERGIAEDALGRRQAARTHYERSQAFGVEPQIPAHNLARSVLLKGDYSEAHDLFQATLGIAPDLPEAHFNDAMALYLWGAAERDPKGCQLERTRELWLQAQRRFSSSVAAAAGGSRRSAAGPAVGERARENRKALDSELEELERLIAEPPPECENGGGTGQSSAAGGADSAGQSGESTENPPGEAEGGGGRTGGAGEQGEDGEDGPAPPAGGGAESDPGEGSGSGELSEEELSEVGRQLERLAQQGREPGKFHRRTRAEQFRRQDWSEPDDRVWW